MIIYKATNKINRKSYIGQTTKLLNERKNRHLCELKRDNTYFHNALKKYGFDNFQWEILCECCSKEELDEKEKYYIKKLNTKKPYGYNLTDGGEGMLGYKHTDDTKKKLSFNSSGDKHWNYGKHWNDEIKQKNSNTQKGKKLTKETKRKISENNTRPMLGKHHSKEVKKKMSVAKSGIYEGKDNPNSKKYKILNLLDNSINIIECLKNWCCKNKFPYDSIRKYIGKNVYKKTYIIEKLSY